MIFLLKIPQVVFEFPKIDKQETIKVSNVTYQVELEMEHTHQALSGRLHAYPHGFRFEATINYDASLEPDRIRTLCGYFQEEFEYEKGDFVRMYPGYKSEKYIEIVAENSDYISNYTNNTGVFRPYFKLLGHRIFSNVEGLIQAFVIDEQDNFVITNEDEKVVVLI